MTLGYRVEDVQAAEKVYREVRDLFWEAEEQKPPKKMPVQMSDLVSNKILELMESSLAEQSDQGIELSGTRGKIVWINPISLSSGDPKDSVVLRACVDQSATILHRKDGATKHGVILRDRAVFEKLSDGHWEYTSNESVESSEKC